MGRCFSMKNIQLLDCTLRDGGYLNDWEFGHDTLLLPAGITSRASIYFKDEATILESAEDVDCVYVEQILPQKMKYNLKSIEEFSLLQEIYLLINTIIKVFGG